MKSFIKYIVVFVASIIIVWGCSTIRVSAADSTCNDISSGSWHEEAVVEMVEARID